MGVGIIHFKNSSQLFLLEIELPRESKFRQNNTKYLTREYNPCACASNKSCFQCFLCSQGVGLNDQNLGTKKLPPPQIVTLGPRDDKNTIHKVLIRFLIRRRPHFDIPLRAQNRNVLCAESKIVLKT